MRKLTLFIALFMLNTSLKGQEDQLQKEIITKKVNEHLIPIHPSSVADSTFEDLMPLKEMIGDDRVVFVGEAVHYLGNHVEMNARLAQFLIQEMGFDYILFESGFYDVEKAQENIDKGNDAYGELSSSVFEFWSATVEFQNLRKDIEKYHVRVGGFDYPSRMIGEDIYYDLKEYLSKEVEEELLLDWFDAYSIVSRWELPRSLTAYYKAYPILREAIFNKKVHTSKQRKQQSFWLRVLDSQHEFVQFIEMYPNVNSITEKEWKAKHAQPRDDTMAKNALWHIEQNPDSKFILWGASGHVSNDIRSQHHPDYNTFQSTGEQIINNLGKEQITILSTTSSFPSLHKQEDYSLEHALEASNYSYIMLPLQSFNSPIYGNAFGLEPLQLEWNKASDILFYADTLRGITSYNRPTDDNIRYIETNNEVDTILQRISTTKDLVKDMPQKEVYLYKSVTKKNHEAKTYSGVITDQEKQEPIPFASIGIPEEHIGVSSLEDGSFSINIPAYISEFRDSLLVSCVGYKKKKVALSTLSKNINIPLEVDINELATLTIRDKPISSKRVMRKVRKRLKKNYYQDPFAFQALYKSRVYDAKNDRFLLVEAIADKNDTNGYQTKGKEHSENKNTSVLYAQLTQLNNDTGEKMAVQNHLFKEYKVAGGAMITEPVGAWGMNQEKHLFLAPRICPINFQQYTLLNTLRKRHYEFQLLEETATHFELLATATIEKNTHFYNTLAWFDPAIFQVKLKINAENFVIEKWEQLAIYPNDKSQVLDVNTNYFINLPEDCRYQKDQFIYGDPEKDGQYHLTYWNRYNTFSNYTFNEGIVLHFYPNQQLKLGNQLAFKKNKKNTTEFWEQLNSVPEKDIIN
ncbi:erythromycin esterase family protein [Flammeovirga sp. OC4]|uniref:erythromycin esterase family protein n=1 Tax=Flammeovirga sp. OC4 TaxID=1382345 RepID=UPI0009E5CF53|nr:erythromycin esterase family protein [Flammeovirga sp. OC4]